MIIGWWEEKKLLQELFTKTRKGKPFPGVQRYSKLSDQRIEEAAGTSQAVRNDGENEPT
jgi:hypothetical protein